MGWGDAGGKNLKKKIRFESQDGGDSADRPWQRPREEAVRNKQAAAATAAAKGHSRDRGGCPARTRRNAWARLAASSADLRKAVLEIEVLTPGAITGRWELLRVQQPSQARARRFAKEHKSRMEQPQIHTKVITATATITTTI